MNKNYAFGDFEFCDYPTRRVISMGVVITDKDGKVLATYESLCRPKFALNTRRLVKMTGITNRDIANARDFMEVAKEVKKLLERFNCSTLYTFSWQDKRTYKHTLSLYSRIKPHINFWDASKDLNKFFNTPEHPTIGLKTFGEKLGINNLNEHRALADAEHLCKIYFKAKEIYLRQRDEIASGE